MTDLFDDPIPPYGSLEPHEEKLLYENTPKKWVRYVAKATATKLSVAGAEGIRVAWGFMSRDYQRAVWAHLSEADRDIVRLVRADVPEEECAA